MANSERETARRKRAEARERRRNQSEDSEQASDSDDAESQGRDAVKRTAKLAAASATTLGAVTAGARALSHRRGAAEDDEQPEEGEATEPIAETDSADAGTPAAGARAAAKVPPDARSGPAARRIARRDPRGRGNGP
jgi:hypothetical protein